MYKIISKYSKNNKFNKDCKLQQTFSKCLSQFQQQGILAFFVIFVTKCFWMTRKIFVTSVIFAKFSAFSRPFSAFCLYKPRILFNLLFLLFLQGVSQNFLVNQFFLFLPKLRKQNWLRESDKRSKISPLGDYFCNSHNIFFVCICIERRKLMLVTLYKELMSK